MRGLPRCAPLLVLMVVAAWPAGAQAASPAGSVQDISREIKNEDNIVDVERRRNGVTITTSISDVKELEPGDAGWVNPPRAQNHEPIDPLDPDYLVFEALQPGDYGAAGHKRRYGCYSQRISKVEEQFSVYQWGITLDKQWCGYSGSRITSQDKQTYRSTGTCWVGGEHNSNTVMLSRGHGRTHYYSKFHYVCFQYPQEESGEVGLHFYASGGRSTYRT